MLVMLAASACISGEGEPPMGDSQILPGSPVDSADYDPSLAPAAPSGAVPTGTAGTAGAPAAGSPAAGASAPSGTAGVDPGATAGVGGDTAPTGTAGTGTAGTAGDPGTTPTAGSGGIDTLPTAGSGDTGSVTPTEPVATGSGGTLTVTFTSVDLRGRYAPRNIGAVWIESGSGTFVKTLERWASIRANDLRTWNSKSGGWSSFFGIGATADELDAVSRATLRSHETHTLTWDMVDNNGQVVPDGAYKVGIDVADGSNQSTYVDFDKGSAPVNVSLPSQTPSSNLTLTYQP